MYLPIPVWLDISVKPKQSTSLNNKRQSAWYNDTCNSFVSLLLNFARTTQCPKPGCHCSFLPLYLLR